MLNEQLLLWVSAKAGVRLAFIPWQLPFLALISTTSFIWLPKGRL